MPKDEFDFADPFELNGLVFVTHEDTTNDMAETFIEEFTRMGHGHMQILALFHNPHYLGPNMALEKRGEPFIRDLITEVFARWGRKVEWPVAAGIQHAVEPGFQPGRSGVESSATFESSDVLNSASAPPGGKMPPSTAGRMPAATEPTGAPIPEFTV